MPTLTPTLIQGADAANQIDEKVMGVVDAIYGYLCATGTPSGAATAITNALFDYYENGEGDKQHFSNLRLLGPGSDNGVRLYDVDDPLVASEIRIRIDADGELSSGSGDDVPTVHIEARTDTGGVDNTASYGHSAASAGGARAVPLVSINENGIYIHQQILDITQATPGDLTGNYELIHRLDFIGTEIARIEGLIGSAGITINGEDGITTSTVGTTVTVSLDTTNNGTSASVGDVLTIVSGGTGYNWEPQTDTIYTPPYIAYASYYDSWSAAGLNGSINITPDTDEFEVSNNGVPWSATSGVSIIIPSSGYYVVQAEVTADCDNPGVELGFNLVAGGKSRTVRQRFGDTAASFSMAISNVAYIVQGGTVLVNFSTDTLRTFTDGTVYVSIAKVN